MSKYKNCRNVQSKSPAGYFERAISQHSLLDSLPAVELSICLAYAHLCVLYSRMCMLVAERISTAHLTQSVRAKLAYHTHTHSKRLTHRIRKSKSRNRNIGVQNRNKKKSSARSHSDTGEFITYMSYKLDRKLERRRV